MKGTTKMSYPVAHYYLGFVPYHEMRNSITVYLLDFQQYTKRQTNPHCGSQSTVFRNLLFTSVLNHRTKCSTPKKLAMKRCSDQTMKGKEKIYYMKPKVNEM